MKGQKNLLNKWRKFPFRLNLKIRKIYKSIFNQLKPTLNVRWGWKKKKQFVNDFFKDKKRNEFVKNVAREIAKIQVDTNKQEFKNLYKVAKSKNLKLPPLPELENKLLIETIEKNYEMITSIPKRVFGLNKLKYVQLIQKQVLEGSIGRNHLEKFLNNLGTKYSKTIARTEVSKLQTAIKEKRAKSLGAEMYLWSSTYDQRTRSSHKNMNNTIVIWSVVDKEKPHLDGMIGHAGEFPNCRCFTEPIFDKRDLPSGALLKVWSVKYKKVAKVNRKDFIDKFWGD